ncbi:Clavaminate synthase-like protein [Teratosphaeria destructans]|uniref:Clavaminate synthase-like protein n=1 Tax=Teratosphaeria destructans TaxID=418781 RepID=A0A9W7SYG0_9PEZI|nr:Clavaminate synthase-like protein [Teratosphaeria destructans]
MAAPFSSPSTVGKPSVPLWIPPEPSKEKLDWAPLHTIDLSLLDSADPQVIDDLVNLTKTAIKEDGFLYLTNYGISLEQLHRQFSLAQYLHHNITDEDKERLLWDPSSGSYAGFKRRTGWQRGEGKFDGIEHFNFYRPQFEEPATKVPQCILPYMDEIAAFCEYLSHSVNRRLLTLLSKVLELPDDFLWDNVQSHDGVVGDGYFRHALFYPLIGEDRERRQGVRMYGHTDYGTTTFLLSVPVTALHIWSKQNKWQPVKYNPGALIVNLGEALEIISGGHFKATTHKVADTPQDQEHCERLSLVQFHASIGDQQLAPAMQSPLLRREGFVAEQGVFQQYKRLMDAGAPVPTNQEWREANISTRNQVPAEERLGGVQEIDGIKYGVDMFLGVKVMLPV